MELTDAERKAWATVQARAALAGITATLIDTDDGRPQLICSKWSLTRAFETAAQAGEWLDRVVGVKPGAEPR